MQRRNLALTVHAIRNLTLSLQVGWLIGRLMHWFLCFARAGFMGLLLGPLANEAGLHKCERVERDAGACHGSEAQQEEAFHKGEQAGASVPSRLERA